MNAAKAGARITLKTILFATDFSPAANSALPYATDLASRFGAKFVMVHAKEPPNYALPPDAWRTPDDATEAGIQELKNALAKSSPKIESEFRIGEGQAWQVIESVVEQGDIDLIVVGTRGRTGAGRLLLGSQAEEVVRRASRPVLTVGPHSKAQGARDGKLTNVLYATDFSPEALAAAPYAISLAEEHEARLTLVHIIEKPRVGDLVQPVELVSSSANLLRDLVPEEAKFWCEPQCVVEEGEPAEKILEIAGRVGASLIVLGVRKPLGVPGAATHLPIATVHKVIAQAACPVLTVRR
ncbi:MAG TPA: universal stress protein [Candidatus Acidoferrales bacterium]|nr:universal stress protein [Candidatus Acidoferrales bacterium]